MVSFDRIEKDEEQPMFSCPHCSENLFEVGIVEYVSNVNISTEFDFKQGHINAHDTQLDGQDNGKQIQCRSCKNVIDMDSDQLDAVFTGQVTEEQMKIQCKIIQRPVFRCPKCRVDIFKANFYECTQGGTSKAEIILHSDGYDTEPTGIENFTDQWSECGHCGARIDIDAINLINYYEGECSLEDIMEE